MALLGRNYGENGYYEEDSIGEFTKVEDFIEILRIQKEGNLHYHDGMNMNKVDKNEKISLG